MTYRSCINILNLLIILNENIFMKDFFIILLFCNLDAICKNDLYIIDDTASKK